MGLTITIRECGEVSILDLRGRSTIEGGSESLGRYLCDLVRNGKRNLLLDLSNLAQLDSSGISVILRTYASLKNKGGELKLLRPCGRVLEVLKVLRLLEVLGSFESEPEALASFRSGRSGRYSATA